MKVLFFMGLNPRNKSGVSWKIWKIERRGRRLQVWWGPALVKARCPVPAATLQTKAWTYRTVAQSLVDEHRRIREKLAKGYARMPRG